MTGYGKAEKHSDALRVKVELKTLNGKFIEINMRAPRQLSEKEIQLRNYLTKSIVRGSVLAIVQFERSVIGSDQLALNRDLAIEYYKAFKEVVDETGADSNGLLQSVFSAPEVMSAKEEDISEEEWQLVKATAEEAFDALDKFRKNEGEQLRSIMKEHCEKILAIIPEVEVFEAARKEKMIEKLRSALAEQTLTENYDSNRMEQELIYYLEKLDIAEEKNRLKEHCKLFLEEISGEVSGKKLGFISQEMGREINTMGSKANFAAIQKLVVNMKEELEKIKEQSFNIL